MDFYDLDLEDCVLDALDAMNFQTCTPVQEHTIPVILDGHDLIGVAQTGTGKTAAYLLPVISMLSQGGYPEKKINCLIMSPTRELAQQIDQAMEGFSYFVPVSSVAVYGGNDGIRYAQELRSMEMGADIVIATPGRLISHLSLGNVDLSQVSFFILDEADRMLDMGFYDDIMQIVKHLPKDRQTIMFSATMPQEIQKLAKTILNDPVEVKLAVSKPAEKIRQSAYICYEVQKLKLIEHLFKGTKPERVIIFAGSKMKVKEVTKALKRLKMDVAEMHSDLTQAERDEVMHKFKNNHVAILVATDIVARGIDIDDITMVINYDVPHDAEDYVHRIGRTARANRDGRAITFVSQDEQRSFRFIEKFLEKEVEKEPVPAEFGEVPEYTGQRVKKDGKKNDKKKDHKGDKKGTPKNGNPKDKSQKDDQNKENRGNRSNRDNRKKKGNKPQGQKPEGEQKPAEIQPTAEKPVEVAPKPAPQPSPAPAAETAPQTEGSEQPKPKKKRRYYHHKKKEA
ncbi:MAG: DEAD/DEAH box helicase [Bacteroidaceae bacterium]|nr:DEAD/DEAH box helicase [Bacteroidaceae bacterium]